MAYSDIQAWIAQQNAARQPATTAPASVTPAPAATPPPAPAAVAPAAPVTPVTPVTPAGQAPSTDVPSNALGTIHNWLTTAENVGTGAPAAALAKEWDYLTGQNNLATLRAQAKAANEALSPMGKATAGIAGQFINPVNRVPGGPIVQGGLTEALNSIAAGDPLSEVERKTLAGLATGGGALVGGNVLANPQVGGQLASRAIEVGGPAALGLLLGRHLGSESGIVGGLASQKLFNPMAEAVRNTTAGWSGPAWNRARQLIYNAAIGGATPFIQGSAPPQ